jgi:hypothetical protein
MHSWRTRMPAGMLLKSEGFASNLYEPVEHFTLKRFCAENAFPYGETGLPVPLEIFTSYGLAFQRRFVPNVEDKVVVGLDRSPDGFLLHLNDGEIVAARRVVVAGWHGLLHPYVCRPRPFATGCLFTHFRSSRSQPIQAV